VIFHVFHTPAIPQSAHAIFGVSAYRFRTLRDRAMTPVAIGAAGGRSAAHVRGALWALLAARADRGVAVGAMSRAQADHLLAVGNEGVWRRGRCGRPRRCSSPRAGGSGPNAIEGRLNPRIRG
jgi:hypothetical protein